MMTILLLFFLMIHTVSFAGDIVIGNTYPIVEKDSIRELEERANSINWSEVAGPARDKLKDYRPSDLNPLPHTKESGKYRVSLVHTVEFDVRDANGEVIYPEGYQFNPLDYVTLPYEMVFIDGNDKNHVAWAKDYIKEHDFVQLFIVDGSAFDLIKELDRKVFYAGYRITDKLHIRSVPSVAYQEGNELKVESIYLNASKNESDAEK